MRSKKHILVADSYQLSREAIAELLSEEDYAVETAADSGEAVSLVLTWKPQLVLIDENLRGWTARALSPGCTRLRRTWQ